MYEIKVFNKYESTVLKLKDEFIAESYVIS